MVENCFLEFMSLFYYMNSIKCCLDFIELLKLVDLYKFFIVWCVKVNDVVYYFDDVIYIGIVLFLYVVSLLIK